MADELPPPPDPSPVAASPDAAADGWTLYQLSAACDGAQPWPRRARGSGQLSRITAPTGRHPPVSTTTDTAAAELATPERLERLGLMTVDPVADAERAERQAAAEEWRTVADWPAYQVSSLGRVRSLPRTVRQTGGRPGYPYTVAGCVLKPVVNSRGGLNVTLYRPGARRSFHVNTLRRMAFGGNGA